MASHFEHSPEFRRTIDGNPDVDWARLALELAADAHPSLDIERHLIAIDSLADRALSRLRPDASVRDAIAQINVILFEEENYRGNALAYYDPRNSYLNLVMERKLGIPISLCALYRGVAERVGLPIWGANLPAHFMLGVRDDLEGDVIYLDAFHRGQMLDRAGCEARVAEATGQDVWISPDHFSPCSARTFAARMLQNLKSIYLREEDYAAALPVLRRLCALETDDPREHRDLGVVLLKLGRSGESIDHLSRYREARPEADDAAIVAEMIRVARRDVARLN